MLNSKYNHFSNFQEYVFLKWFTYSKKELISSYLSYKRNNSKCQFDLEDYQKLKNCIEKVNKMLENSYQIVYQILAYAYQILESC